MNLVHPLAVVEEVFIDIHYSHHRALTPDRMHDVLHPGCCIPPNPVGWLGLPSLEYLLQEENRFATLLLQFSCED